MISFFGRAYVIFCKDPLSYNKTAMDIYINKKYGYICDAEVNMLWNDNSVEKLYMTMVIFSFVSCMNYHFGWIRFILTFNNFLWKESMGNMLPKNTKCLENSLLCYIFFLQKWKFHRFLLTINPGRKSWICLLMY